MEASDILKISLIFLFISAFTAFSAAESNITQQEVFNESLEMDYVYSDGCPYCAQQEEFHEDLTDDYPELEINKVDINSPGAMQQIEGLEQEHDVTVDQIVTPMTFIEGEFFPGFNPSIGDDIRSVVEDELGDPVEEEQSEVDERSETTYIPYIGELDLAAFSLPFLAILLGLVDGLNVCSIGALLLVLGIVIKFDSRRKILTYGGIFIFTTVAVYGGIIFVWYNVLEAFIGYFNILNFLIGAAGVLGGIYFFREFLQYYRHGPTCKTTTNKYVTEFRNKVSDRLHSDSSGFLAVGGAIALFAAGITLVELPCSVALPLVFTGVLADASLSMPVYVSYILLYLLMYMLIELVIFLFAVFTKDIWYGPDKAVTWTTLIASIVLIVLGLYYLPFIPIGM